MGFHRFYARFNLRDNEKEIELHSSVASISLGTVRDFQLRNYKDKSRKEELKLAHGSLLIMGPQNLRFGQVDLTHDSEWEHCLPKRLKVLDQRINITFRMMH